MDFLKKILFLFGTSKYLFILLLLLFTISSIIEVVGIGLLGTYVSYIINPENFLIEKISKIIGFFYSTDINIDFRSFSYIIILIFTLKFLIKISIDVYLEYFTLNRSKVLRNKLLNNYINLKNQNFYSENTSAYVETILRLTEKIQGPCMSSLLKIFCDGIILMSIIIFLVSINLNITLISLFIVFLVSFPFVAILHPRLRKFSENQSFASKKIIQNLYELLEGIFELKIYNKINFFYENFKNQSLKIFQNTFKSNLTFFFVRPAIELVFILLLICTLLILMSQGIDLKDSFTIISIFVISFLRIIPITTSIVSAINRLSSSKFAVEKIYNDLTKKNLVRKPPQKKFDEIKFQFLNIKNVNFKYEKEFLFKNLNLKISKNSITAIFGESGSGKSTLVKIILGILRPSKGDIKINNKVDIYKNLENWQNKISYIPQDIFVFEDTIAKNIALSDQFDEKKIHECLIKVGLKNFAGANMKKKITQNGSNLSGGQKQRIAIARSLFFEREILILDEITSQLDKHTEKKIFELVKSFKNTKTIIFISHNEVLLNYADKIIDIKKLKKK